jgi:hypothetical protein
MAKLVEAQFPKLVRDPNSPSSHPSTARLVFVKTHCRILGEIALQLAYKGKPPYDVDLTKSVLLFQDGKSFSMDQFSKEIVTLVREDASSVVGEKQSLEELERSAGRVVADVHVSFNQPAAIRTPENRLIPVLDASAAMEIERVFGHFGEVTPFSLDPDSVAVQSSTTWEGKDVTVVFKEEDGRTKIGFRRDGLSMTQQQEMASIRSRITLTIERREGN